MKKKHLENQITKKFFFTVSFKTRTKTKAQ